MTLAREVDAEDEAVRMPLLPPPGPALEAAGAGAGEGVEGAMGGCLDGDGLDELVCILTVAAAGSFG